MNDNLNDLFNILIGTIVALNSISIPISYQIISTNLKQLLSTDSHLILLEEKTFKGNIYASTGCLLLAVAPLIFNIFPTKTEDTTNPALDFFQIWYLIFTVLATAGFFIAFAKFSYRSYEYSSNAEQIMFEKAREKANQYLSQLR